MSCLFRFSNLYVNMPLMPRELATVFTEEQVLTMVESGKVLDCIDDATRDHVVEYDPAQDIHPNLVSFNKFLAEGGIAMRGLSIRLPDGSLNVRLQRRFAEVEPERFGRRSSTFRGSKFTPYRALDVAYTGLVHVGFGGTKREESYTTYRVHQPDGRLHGLGLIIASTMVHKRELIPVDRGLGALGRAFKTATQRLFSLAANTEDTQQAEQFEKVADNATRQEFMMSDSFEPEAGYQILDLRGARQLSDTLRFALVYGEEAED